MKTFKDMTELNNYKEHRQFFWNVIVEMEDGALKSSCAIGHDLNGAMFWFNKATYIKASADRKRIVEFLDNPSITYDEFLKKEKELKIKYSIY